MCIRDSLTGRHKIIQILWGLRAGVFKIFGIVPEHLNGILAGQSNYSAVREFTPVKGRRIEIVRYIIIFAELGQILQYALLIQLRGIRIRILVEHIRGVVGGDQCFDFLQIGRTVRDIDMIPGNIRIHLSLILFKDVIQALVRGKIFRPYGVDRPVLFRLVGAAIVFAAGALRLRRCV